MPWIKRIAYPVLMLIQIGYVIWTISTWYTHTLGARALVFGCLLGLCTQMARHPDIRMAGVFWSVIMVTIMFFV